MYNFHISREQYKKIKKMDHMEMDRFIVNFANNLSKDIVNNTCNKEFEIVKDDNYNCMVKALDNTKGIGEKIKTSFLQNYDAAVKNFIDEKENENAKRKENN